jgi:Transglutaminase-like superfamily/TgpA N-terminal domain
MAKTFGLSAVAGGLIAWNWMRLDQSPRLSQVLALVLLAIAPALVRGRAAQVAASVVAFLVAAGAAFELSLGVHYPGRLFARFGGGFADFYDVKVPFDAAAHPNMRGAILLGAFAFTLAAALAIAARRPLLATLALLVGAAWPATLLAGHDLVRGAAILAGLLVVLIGLSGLRRPAGLAVAGIAAVTLAGASASASPFLAKPALLDWQSWNFNSHPEKPVAVSYVWGSDYRGFSFPRKKTVVFRIAAPAKAHYWRVALLDAIIGGRWVEDVTPDQPGGEDTLLRDPLLPARAQDRSHWIHQEVTVGAIKDRHLVAISTPVSYGDLSKLGQIAYGPGGVGYAESNLHAGERYAVSSYSPEPTPVQLARSKPDYPSAIAHDGVGLDIARGASVQPFGTPGRDWRVRQLLDEPGERPYLPLFLTAERIAGGARSPYAATVALESWFRTGGSFAYDQHPPASHGVPALVDFVTRTHSGYCQHFAGAMALMLRYLGIPSRVVAGFSSGHYDHGVWVVTDHDAHEWVEVWFRGWGWLPFDPTPGQGGVSGNYSASSKTFDAAAAALVLAGKNGLKAFARHRGELGFERRILRLSADVPRTVTVPALGNHHSRSPGLFRLLLLVVAGIAVAICLTKLAVRRGRYLTRNPRRLAAASGRELRDILVDQRVDVPASATLQELAALVEAELGVDAKRFGLHATAARFGPISGAREAEHEMRLALRVVRRAIRAELTRLDRIRGLLSLRSLGLA